MNKWSRYGAPIIFIALWLLGASLAVVAQKPADAYRTTLLALQQKIESGDLVAAHSGIVEALRRYPHRGGLENLLGVVAIQQGNAEQARKAFAAALEDDPQLTSAYLNLLRIDMEQAATDAHVRTEAQRLAMRAVQLAPANDEARYQLAMILLWQKDYRRSLEQVEKLSPGARTAAGAQALECADTAALGNGMRITATVEKLAGNADLTEQDAFTCLDSLRAARQAQAIETLFAAAQNRRPLSPRGLRVLGLAQEATGNLAAARATLERAFAEEKTSVITLIDLTRVAGAQKDDSAALGYLAHARDLAPHDANLAYQFGVICARMGLLAEARKAIAAALVLEPENAEFNLGMGTVVSYSEDPVQAIPYLDKYHAARPQDENGVLALGGAYYRAKEYESAKPWLLKSATYPQTAAEAHYYLGCIARQEGKLEDAESELAASLAAEPGQASALAEMGQIALARQNYLRAAELLEEALRRDGDNYAANFGLLQLYARTGDARRKSQFERFEQVKNKRDEQDLQRMRSLEIRRNVDVERGADAPAQTQQP